MRNLLKNNNNFKDVYSSLPNSLYYEKNMLGHLINNPDDYRGSLNTLPYDLKNLLVSAFQSYLFNKMVSLRVKKGISLFKPVMGDTVSILEDDNGNITQTKYIYGGRQGVYDKHLDKALKLNRATIVVPIIGFNTNLDDFPLMKSFFEEIIKQETIDKNIFQSELLTQLDFKGSFRAITVKPMGLKIIELNEDDLFYGKTKLKIEFSLLRGSYATMMLRELMK
jgi:tRNA pseudouridine13 synthase